MCTKLLTVRRAESWGGARGEAGMVDGSPWPLCPRSHTAESGLFCVDEELFKQRKAGLGTGYK